MSKKKEAAPQKIKKERAPKSTALKVSKSAKIMATMGTLRGLSFRKAIRLFGEAEQSYKLGGRLVFGK